MAKLHELLAAEKTVLAQSAKLFTETTAKLGKSHFWEGFNKTLTLVADSPTKAAIEEAAKEVKLLPTNVADTLAYFVNFWSKSEDLLFSKNVSNQFAKADIIVNGIVLVTDVPVDELMGLEHRLEGLRQMLAQMPTLDASKTWSKAEDLGPNIWRSEPEVTIKTDKTVDAVVLYPATDKFPAQVKEFSKDITIGSFKLIRTSGAVTSVAKSDILSNVDNLIMEVKKARTRANDIEAKSRQIGKTLMDFILAPLSAE